MVLRRQQIGSVEYIKINLDNIDFSIIDDNNVVVSFNETYESSLQKTQQLKEMSLRRYDNQWLIVKESQAR